MFIALGLLYFNRHSPYMKYPVDYGIEEFERISIQSMSPKGKNITLSGWWIPAIKKPHTNVDHLFNSKNNQVTIIVVHGHGTNISKVDRKSDSLLVKGILPFYYAGFNILTFDFRNHGKSQNSKPISFGYYESDDIIAAINWIKNKAKSDKSLNISKLAIWSESMGAASTIFAASKDKDEKNIKAIICISPFAEFRSPLKYRLNRFLVPFLYHWISFWFNVFSATKLKEISPIDHIKSIKAPILFFHGRNDKIIPFSNSEKLVQAAQSKDSKVPFVEFISHNYGHVQSYKVKNYYYKIVDFVSKIIHN